MRTALRSQE